MQGGYRPLEIKRFAKNREPVSTVTIIDLLTVMLTFRHRRLASYSPFHSDFFQHAGGEHVHSGGRDGDKMRKCRHQLGV